MGLRMYERAVADTLPPIPPQTAKDPFLPVRTAFFNAQTVSFYARTAFARRGTYFQTGLTAVP